MLTRCVRSDWLPVIGIAACLGIWVTALADSALACGSPEQRRHDAGPGRFLMIFSTDACDMTSSSSDSRSSSRRQELAKSEQAIQFAATSMENLSQDMAQGGGEYLASLALLLEVPADRQDVFFSMAQEQYPRLTQAGASSPAKLIRSLETAMASHPALATAVALR